MRDAAKLLCLCLIPMCHLRAGEIDQLYVKKSTFAESMHATRASLRAYYKARGFKPVVRGLMNRKSRPYRITVDVSSLDKLYLVAHHSNDRVWVPVVWGEAKLIDKEGKETQLAALKPASFRVKRKNLRRYHNKPDKCGPVTFKHGIYAMTPAEVCYQLDKKFVRLETSIGIADHGDRSSSIRFKVLDRPNKEDLNVLLWQRVARDFRLEASLFYDRDGEFWFGYDHTAGWEGRIVDSWVLRRTGKLADGLRKDWAALCKEKRDFSDTRMLDLYSKACRFHAANAKLNRVSTTMIRKVVDDTWGESASFLKRLEPVEARLAAIHKSMLRSEEALLGDIPEAVKDAQALLRESLVPALGTEKVLFTVRDPGRDGHWYANFGYWCSDPDRKMYCPGGSRLAVMNMRTGEVADLLEDGDGAFRDPQLHYRGEKLIFSWRKAGTEHYHLYEVNVDGSGLRQITDGDCDDIEATYLPNGDIVFCSSRCNRWVNCWHTPVAILYRCGPNGENVRVLSSNVEHDNTPWPLPDGRILYTRWEYVDRNQVTFHHLWTINPDGTGQMTYFGNMYPGRVFIDAKPIPGTNKVVASFNPGHGRREHAGAIGIITPAAGPDEKASEKVLNKSASFRDPYPLSDKLFLVARDKQLLVMDETGVTQELYCAEKFVHEPRPARGRRRERVIPDQTNLSKATGRLILQDAYVGRNMDGIKPGEIKKLLVVEALPKPVNHSGGMDILSMNGTFTIERVLGTVPVEPDGSAYFEAPANRPIFFVALDEQGLSVKRMQSFTSVLPGETTSCVGCHEHRGHAPLMGASTAPMATRRPASRIEPFEGVPDVIDFPTHVQPILDKHCVPCHNYEKFAGRVALTSDYGPRIGSRRYTHGYWTLLLRKQFIDGGNGTGNRAPRTIGTGASPIMQKILKRHHAVKLSPVETRTVANWIDTGAAYAGTYASLLTTTGPTVHSLVWGAMGRRCGKCHNKDGMRLPTNCRASRPSHLGRIIPPGAGRFATPLLFNESRPAKSRALLAPLAKEAGGYGICPGPVFKDTKDPDYQRLLKALDAPKKYLEVAKLYHMPGFKPNKHYVREMRRYGVLPATFDVEKDPIDVFETDQAYWRTMWHRPAR